MISVPIPRDRSLSWSAMRAKWISHGVATMETYAIIDEVQVSASENDETARNTMGLLLPDAVGRNHCPPPELPSSSQLRTPSPERGKCLGDHSGILRTRRVSTKVADMNIDVPEPRYRSAAAFECSFDPSGVNLSCIHGVLRLRWLICFHPQ